MTLLHRATPERLSAFSDGVFAVLITVLVLELRPPEQPTFAALLALWPTWLSYSVSYLFIAILWVNHHYLMRFATEATHRLLWFNFAHLFSMSLLPLSTAWMAVSRLAPQPVAFYANSEGGPPDEAKSKSSQEGSQSRTRADDGQAWSRIGQIGETGQSGRRPGENASADQGKPWNTALRDQPPLEPRGVRRPARDADQARIDPEGERWLGDAVLSGLTPRCAGYATPRPSCARPVSGASSETPAAAGAR
jgi:hypothetical protein